MCPDHLLSLALEPWLIGGYMRRLILLIFALIAVTLSVVYASTTPEYAPNQLLIVTNGIETDLRLQEMNAACGTRVEQTLMVLTSGKIYLLQITDGRSVENAIRCWKQFPEVESAEPNYIVKPLK